MTYFLFEKADGRIGILPTMCYGRQKGKPLGGRQYCSFEDALKDAEYFEAHGYDFEIPPETLPDPGMFGGRNF